jgi:DNA-directed RNA polymerase subunit RPC12/RpoP
VATIYVCDRCSSQIERANKLELNLWRRDSDKESRYLLHPIKPLIRLELCDSCFIKTEKFRTAINDWVLEG